MIDELEKEIHLDENDQNKFIDREWEKLSRADYINRDTTKTLKNLKELQKYDLMEFWKS